MRPISQLVTPWLLAAGFIVQASPASAQVVVHGGVGVTIGSPPPVVQSYPYPPPKRRYPAPGYPAPYPGGRGGWESRGGAWWAFQAGYDDGYREGLEDARDRDRYDPIGQRGYRRGSRAYDRRHGPKAFYQYHYRLGFRDGYERGYREGLYAYSRHWPGGRWRGW